MTEKNPPDEPIKCYGITITFQKPLELTSKPFSQYNYTRVIVSKLLGQSCVDFRAMPEFTIAGRIHYHGLLKIKNFAKWVKLTLPSLRRLGYCKIESFKAPENLERWTTYMYKSKDDTKMILGIKDSPIEVNMNDYLEWKKKEATIETFVGKPKIVSVKYNTKTDKVLCQLNSNMEPSRFEIDRIEDGVVYYRALHTELEESSI